MRIDGVVLPNGSISLVEMISRKQYRRHTLGKLAGSVRLAGKIILCGEKYDEATTAIDS